MQHKTCYAQILDQKRKFLEAALRYIDLMRQVASIEVEEAEIKTILEKACKCAILAPAGPQRQRVMGTLYRDERINIVSVSANAGAGARAWARCSFVSIATLFC